jgi:hypothetical protein
MFDYLEENEISLDNLTTLGSDGTALNTGIDNGIMRLFELRLNRPLQRIVCLLHTNELPLRKLFRHQDGETSGPTTFTGPIGKQLHKCHQMPILDPSQFEPIICTTFPVIEPSVCTSLSQDQKIFYDICQLAIGRLNQ